MSDHIPIAPIPGSIVKAICAVQATLAAVAKSDFNKHGSYKFASTDDIYAAVTKKLGEVGLMIYPLELTPAQEQTAQVAVLDREGNKTGDKTVTKLRFHFGYMLATEEASWFDPRSSRSIVVLHTGPQTFNAAESYCQKAYLRALLKIPTGDQDLGGMPQADTEEDQAALNAIGRVKRKSSAEGKRDGSVKVFNELLASITATTGAAECQGVWAKHASFLSTVARGWYETLSEAYIMHMKDFGVDLDPQEQSELIPQAAE